MSIKNRLRSLGRRFPGSIGYWEERYREGGTSGPGSAGPLADFKAGFLNGFVESHRPASVIELGCGDGRQLALARYPSYIGLDVSKAAIGLCRDRFAGDPAKSFFLYDPACFVDRGRLFRADLALSIDVVYHVVEDAIFEKYMSDLFGMADRFVIVYSSNVDRPVSPYVRHREFTRWVAARAPAWTLREHVPNRHPFEGDFDTGSIADFFVFEKAAG
jgi:SAM-dependent methyltransferase